MQYRSLVGFVPLKYHAPADAKNTRHALEAAAGLRSTEHYRWASQWPHELMRCKHSDAPAASRKGDTGRPSMAQVVSPIVTCDQMLLAGGALGHRRAAAAFKRGRAHTALGESEEDRSRKTLRHC